MLIHYVSGSIFFKILHTDSDRDEIIISTMNLIIGNFGFRVEWRTVNECEFCKVWTDDNKYYHPDRLIIDIIQVFIMKNDKTPWLEKFFFRRSIMRTTCDTIWQDPHVCSKDVKWNSKPDHISPDPFNVEVILPEDHVFVDDTQKIRTVDYALNRNVNDDRNAELQSLKIWSH